MKTMNSRNSKLDVALVSAGAALALLAFALQADAQVFTSGSDGSYGPLVIGTNTTLNMPSNGIFNCTTIIISNGATLTFTKNALNTPVYLLATGDVTISGVIDVSGGIGNDGIPGEGGPGGFDGGFAAENLQKQPGDGFGPGGGRGGFWDTVEAGAFGTTTATSSSNTYGNTLLIPLIGGSGGGGTTSNPATPEHPGLGGGGGGGAILIASTTLIQINSTGLILANGGNTHYLNIDRYGSGSGGAIRLVSPKVSGTGGVRAPGGARAGSGIIRVDAFNRTGLSGGFVGKARFGQNMVVFPAVVPKLRIIEAAGTPISTNAGSAVNISLPAGSSTNQTVKILATDFTNTVYLRITVTPERGGSSKFDTQVSVTNGNPAEVTVPITLPAGEVSRVSAWTR